MATHSSVFAWRIPGTAEPGGLPSMGSHRVGHDWSNIAAAARSLAVFCFYLCPIFSTRFWLCMWPVSRYSTLHSLISAQHSTAPGMMPPYIMGSQLVSVVGNGADGSLTSCTISSSRKRAKPVCSILDSSCLPIMGAVQRKYFFINPDILQRMLHE